MTARSGVPSRRDALVTGTLFLAACGTTRAAQREHEEGEDEDVTPNEDLMREHGALRRILLVYREAVARIEGKQEVSPDVITSGARLVRTFVEDYHEQLEEQHLFPRFEKAGKLQGLVATLRTQHQAGRTLTDQIVALAPQRDDKLIAAIRAFDRMYQPHAAFEDTILFPALHQLVGKHAYAELGEQFEDEERRRFGQGGFEHVLDQIAGLERQLGIADLARYTPA